MTELNLEYVKELTAMIDTKDFSTKTIEAILEEGTTMLMDSEESSEELSKLSYAMGTVFLKDDDKEMALACYLRSLEMNKEVFTEEHPYTAAANMNVADVYLNLGDQIQAEFYYTNAVDIAMKTVGDDAPFTIMAHYKLGAVCANLNKAGTAIGHYTYCMVALERTEQRQILLAEVYLNLAELYFDIGEDECANAKKFYRKAKKLYQELNKDTVDLITYINERMEECDVELKKAVEKINGTCGGEGGCGSSIF